MFISCGQDELYRRPKKAYFSCLIGLYFLSFFYEHPVLSRRFSHHLSFSEVVRSVEVLHKDAAKLPCNIVKFNHGEDRAKLIMWFKNGSETPFYM